MDQSGGHAVLRGGGVDQVVILSALRRALEIVRHLIPHPGRRGVVFCGDAEQRIAAGDGFDPVNGLHAGQGVKRIARQQTGQRFGGQGGGVSDEAVRGGGFDARQTHPVGEAGAYRQHPKQQGVNPRQSPQCRQRQQQHPGQHRPQRRPHGMPALAQEFPRMRALYRAGQGQVQRHQDRHRKHPDQKIGQGHAQHRGLGVSLEAGRSGHGGAEHPHHEVHGDIAGGGQEGLRRFRKRSRTAARRRLGARARDHEPQRDGPAVESSVQRRLQAVA